jgi:4'-phosphopantetheinyl transferase
MTSERQAFDEIPDFDGATCRQAPLQQDEVHIWLAQLAVDDATLQHLTPLLSRDEIGRSARFVFDKDRRRYVAGRGLLRQLLGRYTGKPAAEVSFSYGAHGKPRLNKGADCDELFFNVSHTKDIAVLAFSRGIEVGADIESLDPKIDVEEIARHFFTQTEIRIIKAAPANQRHEIFFQFWTRKEAIVKAEGRGLSIPLTDVDVSNYLDVDGSEWQHCKVAETTWLIRGWTPEPGYAAAIACTRQPQTLSLLAWAH